MCNSFNGKLVIANDFNFVNFAKQNYTIAIDVLCIPNSVTKTRSHLNVLTFGIVNERARLLSLGNKLKMYNCSTRIYRQRCATMQVIHGDYSYRENTEFVYVCKQCLENNLIVI